MIYRHTASITNVHNILHTVQSYSFQVPQHADTVELKRADSGGGGEGSSVQAVLLAHLFLKTLK